MKNIIALFTLFLLLPTTLSAPTAETTPSLSPSSTLPAATHRQQPNSTPMPTQATTPLQLRAQSQDEEKGQPPRTSQFWLDFTKSYDPLTQAPRPTDLAQPQGGGQEDGGAVPFSQTTYYTCKTRDATITHCGWHIPITWVGEAGGGSIHGERGRGVGTRAVVVGAVALVVAVMI